MRFFKQKNSYLQKIKIKNHEGRLIFLNLVALFFDPSQKININQDQFLNQFLSRAEKKQFQTKTQTKRKLEFFWGRLAVKLASQKFFHQPQALKTIEVKNKNGRPFIDSPFAISISHTEGLAMGLVSHQKINIGLDCEKRTELKNEQLIKIAVPSDLIQLVRKNPHFVYDYWTAREAIFKARPASNSILEIRRFRLKQKPTQKKGGYQLSWQKPAGWQSQSFFWQGFHYALAYPKNWQMVWVSDWQRLFR